MAESAAGPARIFISYRRVDAGWPARWLADQLAGQFGAGVVFQDVDSIRPGDDFAAEIEAAVGTCSALLALIGPRWLSAVDGAGRRLDDSQDWVRLEIETALNRGVRIIPVLVDGARMPTADELPLSLRSLARRQAISLNPASLATRGLIAVLKTVLAHEEIVTGQAVVRTPEPVQPAQLRTSRVLIYIVEAAFTFTFLDKVQVLTAVVRAAAVAAPERAGWLAVEAEAAARSIADASLRSRELASVAQAVAAADPEHGEVIARSIEDAARRSSALAQVAQVVAAADPERAEVIARSIEDTAERAFAFTGIVEAVAAADPEHGTWLAAEAEVVARSIEDTSKRAFAFTGIVEAVAAADPERAVRLAVEAEAVARSSGSPVSFTSWNVSPRQWRQPPSWWRRLIPSVPRPSPARSSMWSGARPR